MLLVAMTTHPVLTMSHLWLSVVLNNDGSTWVVVQLDKYVSKFILPSFILKTQQNIDVIASRLIQWNLIRFVSQILHQSIFLL